MIRQARPTSASRLADARTNRPPMSNQLTAARLVSTSANSRQNTPRVSSRVSARP